jgi:hypothetical protein
MFIVSRAASMWRVNVWWLFGLLLVTTWFLYLAPKALKKHGGWDQLSVAFRLHLLCAASTTIFCLINLALTPLNTPHFRRAHKLIGKCLVCTSIVGTAFGYYISWFEETAFFVALALSFVGGLQLFATVSGFWAIKRAQDPSLPTEERKRLTELHRTMMTILFYGACLGPAWSRLPGWLGLLSEGKATTWWALLLSILPSFVLSPLHKRASKAGSFF